MSVVSEQSLPRLTAEEAHERVHALARGCEDHPALKNPFYDLWMAEALTADGVELVAKNFSARVFRTPVRIALAFLHMTDMAARAETVENLYDEMGHGDPVKAHPALLREFLQTLLSRMRGHEVNLDTVSSPLLPSTIRLIEHSEAIFSGEDPLEVSGALLAQEWHAYPQLVYLYEGMRNYRRYFGLMEFHEKCEYFYLHIGATEKEHKVHSLATAARACKTVADVERIERGFTAYLDLLAENWHEIYQSVRPAWPGALAR